MEFPCSQVALTERSLHETPTSVGRNLPSIDSDLRAVPCHCRFSIGKESPIGGDADRCPLPYQVG
jgi:hypothetical protein